MPVSYPEPLERIDSEIDEQGFITTHDAYQYRRILGVYAREARKKDDPILAQEVARLQAKVDSATMAPPLRMMSPVRHRADYADAQIVWEQISPEEREMLLRQLRFPEDKVQLLKFDSLDLVIVVSNDQGIDSLETIETVAGYPRSPQRREYLRGRQVRAYRRWY